jgi:hypothetical protein
MLRSAYSYNSAAVAFPESQLLRFQHTADQALAMHLPHVAAPVLRLMEQHFAANPLHSDLHPRASYGTPDVELHEDSDWRPPHATICTHSPHDRDVDRLRQLRRPVGIERSLVGTQHSSAAAERTGTDCASTDCTSTDRTSTDRTGTDCAGTDCADAAERNYPHQ